MTERPLRFCHITTFYPPYSFGGDAVYVQQLANALAARGHHVEIIHCLDSYRLLAHGETLRAAPDHPNVIVHRLESGVGALSPLATQQTGYPFFKTKQIEKILAQGFDVIHYHNISLVGGPNVLSLHAPSPRAGVDAVKLYSTHEYWLVCPMNVLFRYDGVACTEKKCLRCTLANKRPPQWWRYTSMLDDALKHLDMLIHPSKFSQAQHSGMGFQPPTTLLRYFHLPARDSEFAQQIEIQQPYFLFVGRFEPLKGAHTLISFFRAYPRARLVLVGDGNQFAELKQLAGDSPNIEFTGWLNHSQMTTLLRDATALIIPSLCFEGGPLVVLEAYLQRTPTIGRAIGSIPDLLESTGGGLTYTDDASLRAVLDELLDNPARRNELGNNGYAAYQEQFTPDAHLKNYFQIIEPLLANKARKST